jgi:hypothetical protein
MAEPDVTKKPRIYHTLYLLNSAFADIVGHIQTLRDNGVFRREYTRLYQSFAQELQAQINDEAFEILPMVELDDLNRFGRVRDAWERSLRDPNDVLLLAAERRKELAAQGKRSSKKRLPRS